MVFKVYRLQKGYSRMQFTDVSIDAIVALAKQKLDGCIVWNAQNTVLGEEALLIYIVPVCYVKTGRYLSLIHI